MNFIAIILGTLWSTAMHNTVEANLEDVFSILNGFSGNPHKLKGPKDQRDGFEMTLPLFHGMLPLRPFDQFPTDSGPNKDSAKTEPVVESSMSSEPKPKTKPKDKVVMSITELFFPFADRVSKLEDESKRDLDDFMGGFPWESEVDSLDSRTDLKTPEMDEDRSHVKMSPASDLFGNLKEPPTSHVPSTAVGKQNKLLNPLTPLTDLIPKTLFFFEDVRAKPNKREMETGMCRKCNGKCDHEIEVVKKVKTADRTLLFCLVSGIMFLGAIVMCIEIIRRNNDLKRKRAYFSTLQHEQRC